MTKKDLELQKLINECYKELYDNAQPSVNWDELLESFKNGEIDEEKDGPVYKRYYISHDNYLKIVNSFIEKNKKKLKRYGNLENTFRATIALGCSPISNPNIVKQWWKEHRNVDVEINE